MLQHSGSNHPENPSTVYHTCRARRLNQKQLIQLYGGQNPSKSLKRDSQLGDSFPLESDVYLTLLLLCFLSH